MASRAEGRSAAEASECCQVGGRALRKEICGGGFVFEETLVVEVVDVGTPVLGIVVDDDVRHEDGAIFFEEVFVVENCVLHYLPHGSSERFVTKDFLEGGYECWTLTFQICNVKTSQYGTSVLFGCSHD